MIVMVGGHWHDRLGSCTDAQGAITHHRDFFVDAGVAWFLPFLERLARGERVELSALRRAARRAGRTFRIERGT
jgi:hypothetical protein